jgi:quercetin dioxygenase-like cupin family protein
MTLTTAADAARHETPNAIMRTLAAPSTGAAELSVWEVRMRAGQRGPVHTVDREQVWLVLDGTLRARVAADTSAVHAADALVAHAGDTLLACAGDTLVVAAGVERRIEAEADLTAIVSSPAGPVVTTPDSSDGRPLPWAA